MLDSSLWSFFDQWTNTENKFQLALVERSCFRWTYEAERRESGWTKEEVSSFL